MNRADRRKNAKVLGKFELNEINDILGNRESMLRILHGTIDDCKKVGTLMYGEFRGKQTTMTHEVVDSMTNEELAITLNALFDSAEEFRRRSQ